MNVPATPADRRALVFGARGQIGIGLLPRLRACGVTVQAVTRGGVPASDDAGLSWVSFDLFGDAAPPQCDDLVFSLGPLDGVVRWLERVPVAPRRVVAFGSTSVHTKRDSVDPRERALAAHLQSLERRLATVCDARNVAWTLLRPTLVYGLGRDRNLTRIATLAQRWGGIVLPRGAVGLRQPIHADDCAEACFQAAFVSAAEGRSYDLPGGEVLRYDEMVRRTLACLMPPRHLLHVPDAFVHAALKVIGAAGLLRDAGPGVLQRLRVDLVFDGDDAARDLAFAPRGFAPRAHMFEPPPDA